MLMGKNERNDQKGSAVLNEKDAFSNRREPLGRRPMSPGRALCLGFLALILLGGLLLTLPAASAVGESIGFLKGLFTATSAVCVTGLSLIEAGRDLSLFGQIVLLCLIQVGGLGFMAFATLGMVLIGRRISLHSRILLSESMNQNGLSGMVRLSLWFFAMALAIELTGAALLAVRLVPRYGTARGLWLSLFTAVSAFCNAGFDLFGNGSSLLAFRQEPLVLWTVIGLIQLGGMGFAVMLELLRHRKSLGRLSLHTKLVLAVNGILLLGGSLAVFLLEGQNPATLGREGMTLLDKVTGSVFQAVTCRTAGFAAVSQDAMNDSTKLLSCLMMFVGASPASTGGGIKTTTLAALLLLVHSVVRGRDRITAFGKEIPQETGCRAVALTFIATSFVLAVTCALSILERRHGVSLTNLVFETVSAVSTTGLSAAGTGTLRRSSQILLMPLMYLGRVGPLTLATALIRRERDGARNRVHFPEEKIMIG